MKKAKICLLYLFIALYFITSLSFVTPVLAETDHEFFTWDNATVYFVMTDRFVDGDTSNNHSYGRELDRYGNPYPDYKSKVGTFHGGDLKGLTQKLNEGYFTDLGVNAIWITSPFEQIHGWVGGLNFRHYAYHGYYALDYTEVDKNMGTKEDLKTFIDTAHEKGIRIIFDVVLNHPGYLNMKDMAEYGYGELINDWQSYYYDQPESSAHYDTYDDYIGYTSSGQWSKWWGADWIRTSPQAPGYDAGGNTDLTLTLSNLPDFKTESTKEVGLPAILAAKWDNNKEAQEMAELNAFFSRTGKPRTPANYLIKWVTDWVREYGVDGFRCDTAKHVELHVWKSLKEEAVAALREWKANNPDKKLDDLDFWMTGEVWGHGVSRSNYFDNGFNSIINFTFQDIPRNMDSLKSVYSDYASQINGDDTFNVLSYISSHDTSLFDRNNLINAGTALLLAPGGVQIYYGDETGRQPNYNLPWDQPTRTDMNWNSINHDVLSHWQKIGQFRNRHPAIGAGTHMLLSDTPHVFSRSYSKNGMNDRVIVAIGASGNTTISVSGVFPDGTEVRDFYTGNKAVVQNGKVTLNAHANKVMLIEAAGELPPPDGVTVYFKKPSNWGTPQLYYYETNPKVSEPQWHTSPSMEPAEYDGWYVYTIEGTQSARVIFKDKNGDQIPEPYQPGFLRSGIGWYKDGIWYTQYPENNTLTVYYKRGYDTPYMHHQKADGSWTPVPGDRMSDSDKYPGYSVLTFDMGDRSQIEAVFTDGRGNWDNNGGRNYNFNAGTYTFRNGSITSGEPDPAKMVTVNFTVNNVYTSNDQKVYIVGSIPELSNWSCADAVGPAKPDGGSTWKISVQLPQGETFEFKAIKKDSTGYVIWEGGSNHVYTVPYSDTANVTINWKY